ncbi:MAG: hypothetical protein P0Y56_13200 [Candidatus Andeanibacterium colombiense]|uniref:Uncharacterized protein n=1 Tax=Candidatus Andeanibacterium colombiense TaxID=3121345 RepID=A0AAJ5X7E3_9SPHN|nr:MAG: hypothetical protein P0Y56_13200 [Sphingomonadaceae bacterium]
MTDSAPSKRPRGRPPGTRKREHAVAAAEAIRTGEFADIEQAALRHFGSHTGMSHYANLSLGEAMKLEQFRDFKAYVLEALKSKMTVAEWRKLKPVLDKRNSHPRIKQKRRSIPQIKAELASHPIEHLRAAAGLPSFVEDDN